MIISLMLTQRPIDVSYFQIGFWLEIIKIDSNSHNPEYLIFIVSFVLSICLCLKGLFFRNAFSYIVNLHIQLIMTC